MYGQMLASELRDRRMLSVIAFMQQALDMGIEVPKRTAVNVSEHLSSAFAGSTLDRARHIH